PVNDVDDGEHGDSQCNSHVGRQYKVQKSRMTNHPSPPFIGTALAHGLWSSLSTDASATRNPTHRWKPLLPSLVIQCRTLTARFVDAPGFVGDAHEVGWQVWMTAELPEELCGQAHDLLAEPEIDLLTTGITDIRTEECSGALWNQFRNST